MTAHTLLQERARLPSLETRTLNLQSSGAEQTQAWGACLGQLLEAGDLICLEGELGSGKTCFVQGVGRGLGIREAIHSPTFILANEHRGGRIPLYHVDVYRVTNSAEANGFGLEDYMGGDGVCIIEWAEKVSDALSPERLTIAFTHQGESTRGLSIRADGKRYRELLDRFAECVRTV